MASPPISSGVTMNTLKSRILNPAQTSIYSVIIESPAQPQRQGKSTGVPLATYFKNEFGFNYDKPLMELTCLEASLPGSSLATIETMDYSGITEKHAYRRLYDDTIDFTFLVTQTDNYQQIRFFDSWMRFINYEEEGRGIINQNFYSRVKYPKDYQTKMTITKFEKNLGSGFNGAVPLLIYNFVDAYPKAINSVPVSYDQSDLLKVTVSFTYTRYYIDKQTTSSISPSGRNNNSPGNPEVPLGTLNPNNNVTSNQRITELQGSFGEPSQSTIDRFTPRTRNLGTTGAGTNSGLS